MSPKNFKFGFDIRPVLRLSYIIEILTYSRVIMPVPSRPTLIAKIEDGTLEGYKTDEGYWVVYEDSFKKWVKSFQQEGYKLIRGKKSGAGQLGMQ